MATSGIPISNSKIFIQNIDYSTTPALSAGAKGYWLVPVPDSVKNARRILGTSILVGHPASANGYQLSGAYLSGDYVYVSYYTPVNITANFGDFTVRIMYEK